jgi:hypothetical protein
MRGYDKYNFPAFDEVRDRAIAQGHEVISPADMDRELGFDENTPIDRIDEKFMRDAAERDLAAVIECDAVALLPGWEKSMGASAERAVAVWLRKKVLDARTLAEFPAAIPDSTNPKDRVGRLKPSLNLIPASAQIIESLVMALGAKKYGPYNWRDKQVAATVYIAAAMRHLLSWLDREDDDSESGVSHLGHARACLGILLDAQSLGKLVDDRPQTGSAAALIARYTKQA